MALDEVTLDVSCKHMIVTDDLRASAFLPIVDEEWPAVKAGLEKRLAA